MDSLTVIETPEIIDGEPAYHLAWGGDPFDTRGLETLAPAKRTPAAEERVNANRVFSRARTRVGSDAPVELSHVRLLRDPRETKGGVTIRAYCTLHLRVGGGVVVVERCGIGEMRGAWRLCLPRMNDKKSQLSVTQNLKGRLNALAAAAITAATRLADQPA